MSKLDKFKEIFGIASTIAKPFVPGAAGSILDVVGNSLHGSESEKDVPGVVDSLKHLAEDNDAQTQAILALNARLKVLEEKK